MNSLRPLYDLARRIYLQWALREISPLHPDVPRIVRALSELDARRRA